MDLKLKHNKHFTLLNNMDDKLVSSPGSLDAASSPESYGSKSSLDLLDTDPAAAKHHLRKKQLLSLEEDERFPKQIQDAVSSVLKG